MTPEPRYPRFDSADPTDDHSAAVRDRCGKRLDNGRPCPSPLTRKGIAVEGGRLTVLVTCPTCDWR